MSDLPAPIPDHAQEEVIDDGSMHGPFRTWHDNGQPCEVAWYEHGKEHGTTV